MKLRFVQRLQDLDLMATQGVAPRFRQGMRALWMDNLLSSISTAFLFNYVPLFALALGASTPQIGALASIASLFGALAPIPGAQLAEQWGSRRRVVVVVWSAARLLTIVMALISLFVRGPAAVYVLITFWALWMGMASLAHPAWVSLSGEIIPAKRRGRFFSSRNIISAFCSMIFVPLAGWLIESIGEPQGYQWSFALSGLFGLGALLFYARIPEQTRPKSPERQRGQNTRLLLDALVKNRPFLYFTIISVIWNFSLQVGGPFFTTFQVEELGASPAAMGWLGMSFSLSLILGQWFWGPIADRKGSIWTFAVCTLIIPVLPFLWFLTRQPWHGLFVRIPSGLIWAAFNLASFNLLLELSDEQHRTQATAAYTSLVSVANIVGPLVGGVVVNSLGYYWDFALSGLGRLLAAVLFVVLLKPFAHSRSARPVEASAQLVAQGPRPHSLPSPIDSIDPETESS